MNEKEAKIYISIKKFVKIVYIFVVSIHRSLSSLICDDDNDDDGLKISFSFIFSFVVLFYYYYYKKKMKIINRLNKITKNKREKKKCKNER